MYIIVEQEQGNSSPRILRVRTNATLTQVTTAGWLNSAKNQGIVIQPSDKVEVYYAEGSTAPANAFFDVSIASATGVITLSVAESNVVLPVVSGDFANFSGTSGAIADLGYLPSNATKTKVVMANAAVLANHIAVYTDTAGTVDDDATTAINAGNIQAGLSGTAGTLISYPSGALAGSLIVKAIGNTGDTTVTIQNAVYGQASVLTIPDIAAASGAIAATASLTNGNVVAATATLGLLADGGIAAANIQNKTNIIAAQSADIGGGGAGPINIVNASVTAASVIVVSILSSTNTVSVSKVAPGAGSFDVTFSADPGASCVISYVIFVAAQ